MHRRGLAPRPPVSFRKLTATWLDGALRDIEASPAMREAASTMGARVRAEDGVARAVEAIERVTTRA